MAERTDNPYRALPAVNDLVEDARLLPWRERIGRPLIVEAAGAVLTEARSAIAAGADPPSRAELARQAATWLGAATRAPLEHALNATGILLHTGLGRAPMPPSAVAALSDVAGRFAPVELDLVTGDRGDRSRVVRDALVALTGAESAVVVNNNAAALTLVLSACAAGRSVLVSRGELIEIGGSFRLPEIIAAGGARLLEVGTTNRTRLDDYEHAIRQAPEGVAAILKVHTSNYRIEGFSESVSTEALAPLARRHGVVLVDDIGSGALGPTTLPGIAGEPDARSAVAAGADLVLFSGDKLLGGPQAGIVVGRHEHVERIARHPLMRAMRVDKLALAALGATLQLHRDPARLERELPLHRMLSTTTAALAARGAALLDRLRRPGCTIEVHASAAQIGGGSVPGQLVESRALVVTPAVGSEHRLARALRGGRPAVIGRVQGGGVWLDLRSILPEEDDELAAALDAALAEPAGTVRRED